jgi:hypothetical protein
VLGIVGGDGFSATVVGTKVRWVLEMIRGPEFAGARIGRVTRDEIAPNDWEYTLHAVRGGDTPIDLEELRDELLELGERGATLRFRQTLPPARDVVAQARDVPGFGWRTFTAVDGEGPSSALRAGDGTLENEHLRVTVDAGDGTLTITTCDGIVVTDGNRLVDGGDGGDTYSYSPPTDDTVVEHPTSVHIETTEGGPVRARLLVVATYELPHHAVGDERSCSRRSDETERVEVRTTLELRAGERFVRIHAELDNRCRDHRLRSHFPLPAPVEGSDAECAFTVVNRGLTAEGGPNEVGLPTFVSRRFVDCSDGEQGLALLHDGLLEYEVVDLADGRGHELALTLLRATGYLSRSELSLRPNPAGPLDPLEGPQLQGRHAVDYAVLPHRGTWRDAELYSAADALLVPLERVRAGGMRRSVPAHGRALRVEGAEVSAVLREDGRLVVRVFNASADPSTLRIAVGDDTAAGEVIDLRGCTVEPFPGSLALRPWQIVTVRLDEPVT